MDLEHLEDQDLHAVMERINQTLQGRFTTRIQEFRELAREMGFAVTLTKLGKEDARRAKHPAQENARRRGISPKYRNPDNPSETWAGRGRKPKWVEDKLAHGASLDDLLINRTAVQEGGIEAEKV